MTTLQIKDSFMLKIKLQLTENKLKVVRGLAGWVISASLGSQIPPEILILFPTFSDLCCL